jgi:hypothetical protein
VREELEKRWLEDNGLAIKAYNFRVAQHGLLSDEAVCITRSVRDPIAPGQK